MADGRKDQARGGVQGPQPRWTYGGYPGAPPGFGSGFGRDFAGALNRGFEGRWGQGYGGSMAPADYRVTYGGFSRAEYLVTFGPRGDDDTADDRSWFDLCVDDELSGRPHHRGQGPRDWNRDDQLVYEAVCERLLRNRLIDARGMEVDVEEGVVTLRGQVRAAADPRLADRLARATPGVREVRLELTFSPGLTEVQRQVLVFDDDHVDKSSLSPPIIAGRAPPPDGAGAP
jgi:hypothetical protein